MSTEYLSGSFLKPFMPWLNWLPDHISKAVIMLSACGKTDLFRRHLG